MALAPFGLHGTHSDDNLVFGIVERKFFQAQLFQRNALKESGCGEDVPKRTYGEVKSWKVLLK